MKNSTHAQVIVSMQTKEIQAVHNLANRPTGWTAIGNSMALAQIHFDVDPSQHLL